MDSISEKRKQLEDALGKFDVRRGVSYDEVNEIKNENTQVEQFHNVILPDIKSEFGSSFYFIDYISILQSVRIRKDMWEDGIEYAENEKIGIKLDSLCIDSYYTGIKNTDVWCAKYSFVVPPRYYNQYLTLRFTRDTMLEMHCESWNCPWDMNSKMVANCVHKAAGLYLLGKYIEKKNPGDETDEAALRLIKNTVRESVSRTGEAEKKDIEIEPVLVIKNESEICVSFKAGTDRLYKIRNISEFVRQTRNHGEFKTGKMSIMMTEERIMDRYYPFYEIMKRAVLNFSEQQKDMNKKNFYSKPEQTLHDTIRLYGKELDDFIDLIMGDGMDGSDGAGRKTYYVRDGVFPLSFVLSDNGHGAVRLIGNIPVLIYGEKNGYYVEGDVIKRISESKLHELMPILNAADDGNIDMRIGAKYITSFYSETLPWLEQIADITYENDNTVLDDGATDLKFEFLLDASDDSFTCEPVAIYKEKNFNLADFSGKNESISEIYPWMMRNELREEEILKIVEEFFPKCAGRYFKCNNDEKNVYHILYEAVEELGKLGTVKGTDAFKSTKIRRKPAVSVGVSVVSGLLDLKITSDDISLQELIEILKTYDVKKKYHRLKNGDFIDTDSESLETLYQMMTALHVKPKEFVMGKMQIPEYRALYLDSMLEDRENLYAVKDKSFRHMIREFKTISESEYEVPDKMKHILREYQKVGFCWMKTLYHYGFGGILADEMGLGKTLQAIALLEDLKAEGTDKTSIVIAPAALIFNWGAEIARFAPDISFIIVTGNAEVRKELINSYKNYDVVITSYDLLKRDIAEYEGKQFEIEFSDETQNIKNCNTAAAKSVKLISSHVRFALTGTPIENRLSELWSIFDYLMPGFLYSYQNFKKTIETPIVKDNDKTASDRLKCMITPFILRRYKKDVLKDLPAKLEEVYYAGLSDGQAKIYYAEVLKLNQILNKTSDEEFKKNRFAILAELMRIRQICCDPGLVFENYSGESAKREACMQLLMDAVDGGHKILVFSQFTSMLDILEKEAEKSGISYYEIRGNTPKQERLKLVNSFNANDTNVFFISLKAGGTGLNLTGADIVIHYDPWWNAAAQNQATDRAHRIGQKNVVTVYKLIMKKTIEEKILQLQDKKVKLADDILSGENIKEGSITKEELLEILR